MTESDRGPAQGKRGRALTPFDAGATGLGFGQRKCLSRDCLVFDPGSALVVLCHKAEKR
jgi:hypothetical protein